MKGVIRIRSKLLDLMSDHKDKYIEGEETFFIEDNAF